MRRYVSILSLSIGFAISGCGGSSSDKEPLDIGDDDDDDGGTDTADTGESGTSKITPVAVGFEFDGVLLEDGTLAGYMVSGQSSPPIVVLTLASANFFEVGTAEEQALESCIAIGTWDVAPRESSLPNINNVPLSHSFEGALVLDYGHNCTNLDDEWGVDGQRVFDVFDGMRLGIGFGQLTDYLSESWSEESLEEYGEFLLAEYIAINAPDGSFVAEDWTSAMIFEWDQSTGELIVNDEDLLSPIPVSHLPLGTPMPQGYVRSFAYWYQDFPLMDFDVLKDNAPAR